MLGNQPATDNVYYLINIFVEIDHKVATTDHSLLHTRSQLSSLSVSYNTFIVEK